MLGLEGTTSTGKSAAPTPKWAAPDAEPEAIRGKGMAVAPPRFAPKDLFQPLPQTKATFSENRPKPKLPVPLGKALRAADDEAGTGFDGPQVQTKSMPARSRMWDPATGRYVEEDLPAEVQEMMAQAALNSPPIKASPMKRPGEVNVGGSTKPVDARPPQTASQKKVGLLDVIDASQMNSDVLDAIERGEALVKEARALVEQGRLPQAKQKYRQGLRCLMSTMPDTPQDGSDMSEPDKLHLQIISDYMTEMEALDGAGAAAAVGNGKGGARQQPSTTHGGKATGGNGGFSVGPGGCNGATRPALGTASSGKALPLPRPTTAGGTGGWEGVLAKGAATPPSKAGGIGAWEGAMAKSGGCPPTTAAGAPALDSVDHNGLPRPRRKSGFS